MQIKIFKFFAFAALFFLLDTTARAGGGGPVIPLPNEDRAAIETYLGKGVVGEAIPAPAVADTLRYVAGKPGHRTFRLVGGEGAGLTEQHQLTQLKQGDNGANWRYDTGKQVFFVTAKSNGDYVVSGVADNDQQAITRYSPPEPFMLQGLAPGDERNVTLGVKVFDLSNPDDLSHEGKLDVNHRYIGAYKVKVPAGRFDAILLKWTLKGKVGPAVVDDTQYRFLAPGMGIVAEVEQMDVSAVLVYNRHKKVAKVLVSKSK
jgi:hypothetical protein